MSKAKDSTASSSESARMRDAYHDLKGEIAALEETDLIHINLDVPSIVTLALGALPEIRALRPKIKEVLKGFDFDQFDKLERYVLALFHAHTEYVTASRPAESMPELVEAATRVRDTLHSDALALVNRGLLDAQQLRDVKAATGYRPLALDLTALAAVLRRNWDTIAAKSAIEPAELAEAESLAERLLKAIGLREQGPTVVAESAAIRQRVYTLFVRAYDEVRRAAVYLRWHDGDVERVVPSLYTGRGGRRRGEPETPASEAGAGAEAKPGADGVGKGAEAGSPGTADGIGGSSVGPGLPGGDPFAAAG